MSAPATAHHDPDRRTPAALSVDRRRLLRGGIASTPVLLSVVSRPVSAGACVTASAFTSLNLSRDNRIYSCTGRLPTYWSSDVNFYNWPSPFVPTSTAIAPTATSPGYTPPAGAVATPFNNDQAFYQALSYGGMSLLQVLSTGAETGKDGVARYAVAALLNAVKVYTPNVISKQGPDVAGKIKKIWSSYETKGSYSPTAGVTWGADQIITWLKTTMS